MEFVDIAGLVSGAASGEGLGNKFLAHIRETDAIAHVVRCFEDGDIIHVAGKIDPIDDIDTIDTELILADMDTAAKALHRAQKLGRSGDKDAQAEAVFVQKVVDCLEAGKPARVLDLDEDATKILKMMHLITAKPVMYIANVEEGGFEGNELLAKVQARAEEEGAQVVAVCASMEAEIALLDDEDRVSFLEDLGLEEAGLDRVIRAGYDLLGLQTFFTAGVKEVRAWTVRGGATAPNGAGCIHTDFERGFIRAEVIAYDDFINCKGEQGAKDSGKWRLEGKDYLLVEGDVVHFRFNV
eukprot:snap_masked-scaffold1_size3401120-processed-gene-28.9 protein:Tk04937 transcript:snap_masked-scaffold1_size3401120-processed-gene-28.9-mRNA-1 annotation:"gtp-binding protein"